MQWAIRSLPPTSSRASVLSTDTDSPPVTKTTVSTNLLHTFNIITKLSIKVLSKHLRVFTSLEILLPVQEPQRNFELTGVLDNCYKLFNFISSKFSGTFVDINFGLLANDVSETTSETLNFCKSENNVSLALNVSVEDTQDVLELLSLHHRAPVVQKKENGCVYVSIEVIDVKKLGISRLMTA